MPDYNHFSSVQSINWFGKQIFRFIFSGKEIGNFDYVVQTHRVGQIISLACHFVKMLVEPPSRKRYLSNEEIVRLLEVLRDNKRLLAIALIGLGDRLAKGTDFECQKTRFELR